MLVFVPLTGAELARWQAEGRLAPDRAYAVTDGLREAFGFGADDGEEAEHTALHIAGTAALLREPSRLVAVVDAPAEPVASDAFGAVAVGPLAWSAVTALFGEDDPSAAAAIHAGLGGATLAHAWDRPALARFLGEHELLWHGRSEWGSLV